MICENYDEGWCLRGNEADNCFCGGDKLRCDFYADVKREGIDALVRKDCMVNKADVLHALLDRAYKEDYSLPSWIIETIINL